MYTTCNPQIRSLVTYPLGHMVILGRKKGRQEYKYFFLVWNKTYWEYCELWQPSIIFRMSTNVIFGLIQRTIIEIELNNLMISYKMTNSWIYLLLWYRSKRSLLFYLNAIYSVIQSTPSILLKAFCTCCTEFHISYMISLAVKGGKTKKKENWGIYYMKMSNIWKN